MSFQVIFDTAAFDAIDTGAGRALRALLRRTAERGGETRCAAVTLAEVCRGTARTRRVEAAVVRRHGGQRILVVPTDERLAKLVGAILYATQSDSDNIADAHVVAAAVSADVALVITSDPADIATLAVAVPGTRVIARTPQSLSITDP